MTKRKMKRNKRSKKVDAVIHEFETKDLSPIMKKYRHIGVWMKAGQKKLMPTSLLLPKKVFLSLEKKASRRGVWVQTLLSKIVQDHLKEY